MTSDLTSLKLSFPTGTKPHYTLSQFSDILRKHPNFQTLALEDGGMPRASPTEAPVSFVPSRLVDLTLCGTVECISGFLNHTDMSSPPYNIVLRFSHPLGQPVTALVDAMRKPLTAYSACAEQDRPRNAGHLTVGSRGRGERIPLVFDYKSAKSPSAPASAPLPTLRLEFREIDDRVRLFDLVPVEALQTFTADRLFVSSERHCALPQKKTHLLHLHLVALDIVQVLPAMDCLDPGASTIARKTRCRIAHTHADELTQVMMPKLTSLTLSRLDLVDGVCNNLLRSLQARRDKEVGLGRLTIRTCRVHLEEDLSVFKGVVKEVEWSDLEEEGSSPISWKVLDES